MEKVVAAAVLMTLWTPAQADTFRLEVFSKYVIKTCDSDHTNEWAEYMVASKCGLRRDQLVELTPHQSHLQITPSAVFVKKCVGVCHANGKRCVARKQREKMIPVRYHDVSTGKDWCAHYPVTEDENCACARL